MKHLIKKRKKKKGVGKRTKLFDFERTVTFSRVHADQKKKKKENWDYNFDFNKMGVYDKWNMQLRLSLHMHSCFVVAKREFDFANKICS